MRGLLSGCCCFGRIPSLSKRNFTTEHSMSFYGSSMRLKCFYQILENDRSSLNNSSDGGRYPGDRLTVAAVQREGDPDPLAILKPVRAPASVRSIDRDAAIMPPLLA